MQGINRRTVPPTSTQAIIRPYFLGVKLQKVRRRKVRYDPLHFLYE